jgi:ubiquinol-cytochrome c reductase cytochrome b subunit
MPAYGRNLSPAEVTALVAFLETLHPPTQAPAQNSAIAGGTEASGDQPREATPRIR